MRSISFFARSKSETIFRSSSPAGRIGRGDGIGAAKTIPPRCEAGAYPFAEQNGQQMANSLFRRVMVLYRKSLIIKSASTRIRTGDLLITNQLYIRVLR